MRLLVSVRSAAEVAAAVAGGADIIDAKEPTAGSLGAGERPGAAGDRPARARRRAAQHRPGRAEQPRRARGGHGGAPRSRSKAEPRLREDRALGGGRRGRVRCSRRWSSWHRGRRSGHRSSRSHMRTTWRPARPPPRRSRAWPRPRAPTACCSTPGARTAATCFTTWPSRRFARGSGRRARRDCSSRWRGRSRSRASARWPSCRRTSSAFAGRPVSAGGRGSVSEGRVAELKAALAQV